MIICWGELLWDMFPDAARLGGAAANVAYHVARLGEPARLVSRVGDDELGRRAIAELAEAGVDTDGVQIDRSFPTGTVRVEVTGGEPRFWIGERAAWDRIECDAPVTRALNEAKAIVFGTLAQRTPLAQGVLGDALATAPAACVRICDLNIRPPFASREAVDRALDRADVLKLNHAECDRLGALFGVIDPVPWLLHERGAALVALTRGDRGCMLVTREARAEHPGFSSEPGRGDHVGAGDAFVAVLACRLVRTPAHDLDAAALATLAENANRYAAYVASEPGAMPPIPEALRARVREALGR